MRASSGMVLFMLPGSTVPGGAHSERRVSTTWAMPARLQACLRIAKSSGLLEPVISIQTSLVLPSLQARVIFRSRATKSDPGVDEDAMDVGLVRDGERLERPRHPVRGIPQFSRLALRLTDTGGRSLAEERTIGECADGIRDVEVPFSVDVSVVAWVTARDWSERRGPRIRLNGELVFDRGVTVRLEFRPHRSDEGSTSPGATEVQVVHPGLALYSPEKMVEGSRPASAWVSVCFLDGTGRPIGDEHALGRCVRV